MVSALATPEFHHEPHRWARAVLLLAACLLRLAASEALLQANRSLDAKTFSERDLNLLLRTRLDGGDAARLVAVQARFIRECGGGPAMALEFLLPRLLTRDDFAAWTTATRELRARAASRALDARDRAQRDQGPVPPAPELGLIIAPLPPVPQWNLASENHYAAAEAVRALVECGDPALVLPLAEQVCMRLADVPQILAAEGYANGLIRAQDAAEAVKACRWATERSQYSLGSSPGDPDEALYASKRIEAVARRARRLAGMPDLAKWYTPSDDEAQITLERIAVSLNQGTASQQDRQQATQAAAHGRDSLRNQAQVLAARCRRLADRDPLGALILLAPQTLEEPGPWITLASAQAKADRDRAGEATDQRVRFPAMTAWRKDMSWDAGCELAACLAAIGDEVEAVALISRIRSQAHGFAFAESSLCGAELLSAHGRHADALAWLIPAAGVASHLLIDRRGDELADPSGQVADLTRRISATTTRIRDLIDSQQYGPDFVAYRTAQRLRLEAKDMPRALAAYAVIRETYPGTVYGEAATAYGITCLITLAREDGEAHVSQRRLAVTSELATLKAKGGMRGSVLLSSTGANGSLIADKQDELDILKRTPAGPAAWDAAVRAAKALLDARPHALYGGEILADLGISAAEDHGRLDEAATYLQRCRLWIDEVQQIDGALDSLAIPAAAATVATPPRERRRTDRMSNSIRVEPAPEHVVNRLTAPWYLEDLQCRCLLYAGMAAHLTEDFTEAKLCFREFRLVDSYGRQREEAGFWSTAQRLLWNLDHNRGGCYGTARELACFRNPSIRIRVLLADAQLEAQDYPLALERFADLRLRYWQRLGQDERAYLLFALAICHGMLGNEVESRALLSGIDRDYAGSTIHPRALLMQANWRIGGSGGPGSANEVQGLAMLQNLAERYPRTDEGESAAYHIGWIHAINGRSAPARRALTHYLSTYPAGHFGAAARSYLNTLERTP